jgi:hypothetical protein
MKHSFKWNELISIVSRLSMSNDTQVHEVHFIPVNSVFSILLDEW